MSNGNADAHGIACNEFSLAGLDAQSFLYTSDDAGKIQTALSVVMSDEFYTIARVQGEITICQERKDDKAFPFILYHVTAQELLDLLFYQLDGAPFATTFFKTDSQQWIAVSLLTQDGAIERAKRSQLPLFIG